jgi:hypothetical protein
VFVDASGHYASWLLADTTILGGGSFATTSGGTHLI